MDRVLLVDDDDQVREVIARRLRLRGLEVDAAAGVDEARALLACTIYGAVISDEHMQDGFGHELLAHVARRRPACRRALVSALCAPADVPIVWEHFFAKPGQIDALIRWTVEQCGDER